MNPKTVTLKKDDHLVKYRRTSSEIISEAKGFLSCGTKKNFLYNLR